MSAIERAVRAIAPKFRFGYYTIEDIEQEGRIIALKCLEKYAQDKGSLGGYVWKCVHNGLFNFKRDNFQRPDRPNPTKIAILGPSNIDHVENDQLFIYDDKDNMVELGQIKKLIDDNLNIRLRPIWIKMVNGISIKPAEKEKIMGAIYNILAEHKINVGNLTGDDDG